MIIIEFLSINGTTGTLWIAKALPGKGRIEPYRVIVSATDHGKPSLSNEVHVLIFITDVSTNDGIPTFIKPSPKEIVYVPEVFDILMLRGVQHCSAS